MNIQYNKLKQSHLDSLLELENLCFSIPWTRGMFESELSNSRAHYTVALCGDRVIGYCGVQTVADEGDITNIAVHPDYRNQGIASTLLKYIIDYCTENGIVFITLEVRESNINAIKLYEKLGFVQVGQRKNYYADNHETALLMTKQL